MKIKKIGKINPVAKYSRNKSGAGYHKDKTKYNRKNKMCGGYTGEYEMDDQQQKVELYFEDMTEEEHEQVQFLINQQKQTNSASLWFQLEEEINAVFDKVEARKADLMADDRVSRKTAELVPLTSAYLVCA